MAGGSCWGSTAARDRRRGREREVLLAARPRHADGLPLRAEYGEPRRPDALGAHRRRSAGVRPTAIQRAAWSPSRPTCRFRRVRTLSSQVERSLAHGTAHGAAAQRVRRAGASCWHRSASTACSATTSRAEPARSGSGWPWARRAARVLRSVLRQSVIVVAIGSAIGVPGDDAVVALARRACSTA